MKRITRETVITTYRYEYVDVTDSKYAEHQADGYSDEDIFETIHEWEGAEVESIDDTERKTTYTLKDVKPQDSPFSWEYEGEKA